MFELSTDGQKCTERMDWEQGMEGKRVLKLAVEEKQRSDRMANLQKLQEARAARAALAAPPPPPCEDDDHIIIDGRDLESPPPPPPLPSDDEFAEMMPDMSVLLLLLHFALAPPCSHPPNVLIFNF